MLVPFPFSAVEGSKRRPALIIASWAFGNGFDYLLCLITSQAAADPYVIELQGSDVENGVLNLRSFIRPSYLTSVNEGLIIHKIANLKAAKMAEVIQAIQRLILPDSGC